MRLLARPLAVLVVMLSLAFPSVLQAQKTTGTIRGVVTDPQGASVVGAEVIVTNTATNASVTVKTNDQGEYVVPELPTGVYHVRVKQGGFKEFVAKGVELHVASIVEINAKLQLGATTEVVTVVAPAVQVQTTSATVGEVIDGTQVRELPLNGRNFIQLTLLQPGVSDTVFLDTKQKGVLGGVDFAVNGNSVTSNLFLLDGASNNDVGSNRTILIYPSLEAIAEFKFLRSSYAPEYGQAGGGVISIATRSGQNEFHGSVFYTGRNDALNATEFTNKLNGLGKDKLLRNDAGYSVGGPIKKDKFFFFFSQEWNREIRAFGRSACVPTAAEKAGDFSAGASCGPDPVLPAAIQDPSNSKKILNPSKAGLAIAQLLPLPNKTGLPRGSTNWAVSLPSHINWREENARLDYNLTKKHALTFRYTQDSWENPAPHVQDALWGDDPWPSVEGNWSQPSKSIIGKMTSTLSGTLVNEAQFSYSNNRINITTGGNPQLVDNINAALPTIYPASLKLKGSQPIIWGGLQQYGPGGIRLISPFHNSQDNYAVRDDLSKIYGNHTIKVGAYYAYGAKKEPDEGGHDRPNFGAADWGLASGATGNALANILNPQAVFGVGEPSFNPTPDLRWRDFEFYGGDTWKVRRNVTLELGLRWSILLEPYETDNKLTSFDPLAYDPSRPVSDACNGVIVVPGTDPCTAANLANGTNFSKGRPGVNRALANNNYHNVAPRIGIAWDPWGDGKTAIRFGAGQYFQRERVGFEVIQGILNAPFSVASSVNRRLDVAPPLTGTVSASPSVGRSARGATPNSWQWNITVERQLAKDTSLEVAYVGNRGIHLSDKEDINEVTPANRLQAAFRSPGGANDLRSMPTLGTILFFTREAFSSYHSLQVLFRSRLKDRAQIQAAYTWSHSISNVELDDSTSGTAGNVVTALFSDKDNPSLDKGNSNINRPHIFTANAIFFLPKLANSGAFARQALGGWEFSLITTAETGASNTVFNTGVSDAGGGSLNNLSGTGYGANQRPNIVPGVPCKLGNKQQVFNPNAFTLNGFKIGTIGNEPRGYCVGPGTVNADLGVYKNWPVGERLKVQFRLEMFNAFNHANFKGVGNSNLNTTWGSVPVRCGTAPCSPTNNVITSSANDNPNPVNGFGTSVRSRGPREIQYTLRFTF